MSYRPNNDLAFDNFQTALNNESWNDTLVITNPDLILDSLNAKCVDYTTVAFPLPLERLEYTKLYLNLGFHSPW